MAVGTGSFEISALSAEEKSVETDENLAEIKIGPDLYTLWRKPSSGQYAMLSLRMSRGGDEQYKGMDRFLTKLLLTPEEILIEGRLDADGVAYLDREKEGDRFVGMEFLWDLYEDDKISDDDLVALLRAAVEIHSGFPTEPSSDSSRSRRSSGSGSTAASRRAASTRSRSS